MAQYSEGHLVGPVRPCAGTKGTTIVVENMFYNNPTRKQALKETFLQMGGTGDQCDLAIFRAGEF